jgi:hypothetical protein
MTAMWVTKASAMPMVRFFEDFFDGDKHAVRTFSPAVNDPLADAVGR